MQKENKVIVSEHSGAYFESGGGGNVSVFSSIGQVMIVTKQRDICQNGPGIIQV